MRRADRLFEIIQIMRRVRKPISAQIIADELETSKRTIYRDIATLIAQRVPIMGEPGIGYVLASDFDMPSLMLSVAEIEATMLGASWVATRGEPELARAAQNLMAKIVSAVPEQLRPYVLEPSTSVATVVQAPERVNIADLRAAIRAGHKVAINYCGEKGEVSERIVWPILLGYRDLGRILAAWCELRKDFRYFRTDRMNSSKVLSERFPDRPANLKKRWKFAMDLERQRYHRQSV